jgi:hypothetical protein
MSKVEKFIHFGCWNKGYCDINQTVNQSSLTQVMKKLNEISINPVTKPDFILVAGDNYYPEKKNQKGIGKVKRLYVENLESGFDCLPKNIESNVILGNHDLETNVYLESDILTNNPNDCNIIDTEINFSDNNPNIKLKLFNSKIISNTKTLILMIDSTIYHADSNDYLECYKKILKKTIEISDISANSLTIEDIKNLQKKYVEYKIDECIQTVKNVVIVAHHPITCYKYKQIVKEIKKDELPIQLPQQENHVKDTSIVHEDIQINPTVNINATAEEEVVEEIKHKIFLVDTPGFGLTDLLYNSIYSKLNNNVNYYYLCADLHLYQYGTIYIKPNSIEDEKLSMIIKQYIVGTGGTDTDENPFKYNTDNVSNSIVFSDDKNEANIHTIRYIINEEDIKKSGAMYGFLECHILNDEEFKFRFISSDDSSKVETQFIEYFEKYEKEIKNKSSEEKNNINEKINQEKSEETKKKTFVDELMSLFVEEETKSGGGNKRLKNKRNKTKNKKFTKSSTSKNIKKISKIISTNNSYKKKNIINNKLDKSKKYSKPKRKTKRIIKNNK